MVNPSQSISPTGASSVNSSNPATTTQTTGAQSQATTAATPIASMAELKSRAPKVYNMMEQSVAFLIIKDLKQHEDRLEEIMKEAQQHYG